MSALNISHDDRELIFELAHKLTGTMEAQGKRHEIVITNVLRRIQQVGMPNLLSYLGMVSEHESELAFFISAVTIHTTSWFRELPHYKRFERSLSLQPSKLPQLKIRLLSAACSTGEELYSFGMILESFRRQYPTFDYELVGFDVDPICIQKAESGFFHINDISPIPEMYRHFLMARNTGENNYLVDPDIRSRCHFHVGNLLDADTFIDDPFDFVICRNVLIYFSESKAKQIVSNLLGVLKADGTLTLGHSETTDAAHFNLTFLGESNFRRIDETVPLAFREKPITVLSVDESSWIRFWLATALAEHGIRVITAGSTSAASELLLGHRCDLIMLDLDMQGESSMRWLNELRRKGIDIPIMLLAETRTEQAPEILDALAGGSRDYVNKSQLGQNPLDLVDRIKGLVRAYRSKFNENDRPATFSEFQKAHQPLFRPDIILAGASTGGTDVLCQLFSKMPPDCPPVVCVQHIPKEFSEAFLDRLARTSGLKPGSSGKGSELLPGHLYTSTADAHIGLRLQGEKIVSYYSYGDKVSGHRPSVDYLFQSAGFLRGKKISAYLLTGMGRDGAQGLLDLRKGGALTLAQNQRSSVVWGMPGEAVRIGAPMIVGNIRELRAVLLQTIKIPKPPGTIRSA